MSEVRNISDVPELRALNWDERRPLPIQDVEGKVLTLFGVEEREGEFGTYVVIEVLVNGESIRRRISTGAQPIVQKMRLAAELGLWPLKGTVVRIGRTWDIQ